MKDPRLSVVMPIFNVESYVEEAIESILNQTFDDFELILINDGSTDNTEQKVLAIKDKRIRYYKNENNIGISETLNKGISLSRGEYIARMDGDDICLPERLEKQVNILDSNDRIGICGASYKFFGAKESTMIQPEKHEAIKVGLIWGCTVTLPVFRKSLFVKNNLRYSTDYFPAEDYKMWADCSKITEIYNIQEVLFFYRVHETQISTEKHEWQLQQVNRIRLEILEYLYPGVSEEQKKFHVESFMSYPVMRINELHHHKKWGRQLIQANINSGHFDDGSLARVINQYLNTRIYNYFIYTIKNNNFTRGLSLLISSVNLLFILNFLQVVRIMKQLFKRLINHE